MLDSIFNNENGIHWLCLLILMLISFLLGWLMKKSYKKEYHETIDKQEETNTNIYNTNRSSSNDDLELTSVSSGVRAVKTMERQGKAVEKPTLNFSSFGKAEASEKDDLKRINGIGSFIEEKLNSIGIYTFEQISKFTDKDIDAVTQLIEFFPGRIKRDNWTNQAKDLLDNTNNDDKQS